MHMHFHQEHVDGVSADGFGTLNPKWGCGTSAPDFGVRTVCSQKNMPGTISISASTNPRRHEICLAVKLGPWSVSSLAGSQYYCKMIPIALQHY